MDFLHRLRASLAHFMYGRYGSDQLGRALLYASILLLFLAYPTGIGLFFILSIAGYGWVLFRIFSRDHEKRLGKCPLSAKDRTPAHRGAPGPRALPQPQAVQVFPLPQLPCAPAAHPRLRRKNRNLPELQPYL